MLGIVKSCCDKYFESERDEEDFGSYMEFSLMGFASRLCRSMGRRYGRIKTIVINIYELRLCGNKMALMWALVSTIKKT